MPTKPKTSNQQNKPNPVVTVECIFCKRTRDVGPYEIPKGEVPMCTIECGGVMVAKSAKADLRRALRR